MLLSRTVTRCNVPYVTFPSLCLFVILFIQRIYFSCLVSFLCFPFIKLVHCLVDNYATFNWKLIYLIALRTLRPQQTERRDYKVIILSSDCHHEDIWITGEQLTQGTHYWYNNHSCQDLHKIMNNFHWLFIDNNQQTARICWGWPIRGQTRGDAMLWGRAVIITGDEMSRHWPLSRWHGGSCCSQRRTPTNYWALGNQSRHQARGAIRNGQQIIGILCLNWAELDKAGRQTLFWCVS